MTKPYFEKTTNLAIEISSKPPIQTMPTPVDNLMTDQSKQEFHPDSEQKIPNSVDTSVAPFDLKFFHGHINPDLPRPKSHPLLTLYRELIPEQIISNKKNGRD